MTNYSSARDQYLESEILSAGPVRRVQLMYEFTLKAIGKARAALAVGDIPARTFQVNRALDILSELALSLDHSCGASVTRELVEIYDYAQRCIIEGSARQVDKPFGDADLVLKTLLEAWRDVPEVGHASVASASVVGPGAYVPADYGTGDSFGVGSVRSSLNQLG